MVCGRDVYCDPVYQHIKEKREAGEAKRPAKAGNGKTNNRRTDEPYESATADRFLERKCTVWAGCITAEQTHCATTKNDTTPAAGKFYHAEGEGECFPAV